MHHQCKLKYTNQLRQKINIHANSKSTYENHDTCNLNVMFVASKGSDLLVSGSLGLK